LEELAEAHWSFMDGYAEAMIARGPTLTTDRTTWTGSMHLVDLPDAQAAQVVAFQEPFYRAGVYGEVLVRRWGNALGRTMWDYPAELGHDRRFLVIGHGNPGVEPARQALEAAQRRWFGEPRSAAPRWSPGRGGALHLVGLGVGDGRLGARVLDRPLAGLTGASVRGPRTGRGRCR
jgi:uncharacterized protein YciI